MSTCSIRGEAIELPAIVTITTTTGRGRYSIQTSGFPCDACLENSLPPDSMRVVDAWSTSIDAQEARDSA